MRVKNIGKQNLVEDDHLVKVMVCMQEIDVVLPKQNNEFVSEAILNKVRTEKIDHLGDDDQVGVVLLDKVIKQPCFLG